MLSTPRPAKQSSAVDETPQTPTQRKKPHCSKCGMPMLGHRRGQCTPTELAVVVSNDEPSDLSAQLKSLCIDNVYDSEEEKEEDKQRRTKRRSSVVPPKAAETLVSLASGDKAALEVLGQPGMMTNTVVEVDEKATRANIERWLENVPRSVSPSRRSHKRLSRPPVTPSSAQSVFDLLLEAPSNKETSRKRSSARTAKPLGRTSSVAERDDFFASLSEKSKKPIASVFTVDMSDIRELEENAKRLKFHARVIAPKYADGTTGDGWLVIGKDSSSVEELFREVEKDVKGSKRSVSTAVGGGAVCAIAAASYLPSGQLQLTTTTTPSSVFRLDDVALCIVDAAANIFYTLAATAWAVIQLSSPTNTRKERRCRTCNEPMKGHSRGICKPRSSPPVSLPPDSSSPAPASSPPPPLFRSLLLGDAPRPIMPGTFDYNDCPSEASVPPASRSLLDRLGPKIEPDDDGDGAALHQPGDRAASAPSHGSGHAFVYDAGAPGTQRRRASAPLQGAPTMIGVSNSLILPEHSVSQRFIRRERLGSESPGPATLAERLRLHHTPSITPSYDHASSIGSSYDGYDTEPDYTVDDVGEEDDDDDDGTYRSDVSTIGFRGRRHGHGPTSPPESFYASSDAGSSAHTFESSASASFSALLRASNAAPLVGIYEVAGKYVPFARDAPHARAGECVPGAGTRQGRRAPPRQPFARARRRPSPAAAVPYSRPPAQLSPSR
ncbi:hypothetical protein DFH11DRAFT_1698129 [Phellopilus nigrolimitatus]|nr:hypothetical protein DFH11DRAFT_1698129 [Phellopilus nigrolimitatus]